MRCAKVWAEGLLSDRNSNTGNGEYREQRHLEPGVQECRGVDGQHHEGGKSDGVEPMAFSPQHAAAKVKRDHPESALNRLAEAGEERIDERKANGRAGCRVARQAEAAGDPKCQTGKDGEVHPGNDEKVERAGALEADAQAMTEEAAVAGKHGGEHGGVVVREAEGPRNPRRNRLAGEADEALAGRLLDGMQAAGEQSAGFCHSDGYIVSVGAAEGRNSLLTKPGGRVPYPGVEKALLGVHRDGAMKSPTTGEIGEGGISGRVEGHAQAFWRWERLAIDRDHPNVDFLAALVADDVGVWREGVDEAE